MNQPDSPYQRRVRAKHSSPKILPRDFPANKGVCRSCGFSDDVTSRRMQDARQRSVTGCGLATPRLEGSFPRTRQHSVREPHGELILSEKDSNCSGSRSAPSRSSSAAGMNWICRGASRTPQRYAGLTPSGSPPPRKYQTGSFSPTGHLPGLPISVLTHLPPAAGS